MNVKTWMLTVVLLGILFVSCNQRDDDDIIEPTPSVVEEPPSPHPIRLIRPSEGETNVSYRPVFEWEDSLEQNMSSYAIMTYVDPDDSMWGGNIIQDSMMSYHSLIMSDYVYPPNTKIIWKVKSLRTQQDFGWATGSFTTGNYNIDFEEGTYNGVATKSHDHFEDGTHTLVIDTTYETSIHLTKSFFSRLEVGYPYPMETTEELFLNEVLNNGGCLKYINYDDVALKYYSSNDSIHFSVFDGGVSFGNYWNFVGKK